MANGGGIRQTGNGVKNEGSQVERLKALANPLRIRILEEMARRPMTVSGVAAVLGESRTKLYRHVDVLHRQGFLTVASQRKISGITERTYRATSNTAVLDEPVPVARKKEFETELEKGLASVFEQTRAEIRRGVEDGRIDVSGGEDGGSLVAIRGYMQITERQAEEFSQRLLRQIKEFDGNVAGDGEETERYGFTIVFHPAADPAQGGDER